MEKRKKEAGEEEKEEKTSRMLGGTTLKDNIAFNSGQEESSKDMPSKFWKTERNQPCEDHIIRWRKQHVNELRESDETSMFQELLEGHWGGIKVTEGV